MRGSARAEARERIEGERIPESHFVGATSNRRTSPAPNSIQSVSMGEQKSAVGDRVLVISAVIGLIAFGLILWAIYSNAELTP